VKWIEAERKECQEKLKVLTDDPLVYAGTFDAQPEPTYRLHRGDPMQPREIVSPGALSAIPVKFELLAPCLQPGEASGGVTQLEVSTNPNTLATATAAPAITAASLTPEQQGRLALARWITAPANPLTARALVNCLLARRLIERGVRFVQLFNGAYAMGEGVGNWDGHKTLKQQYTVHAPILDQPCAALIQDLKSRGLLDRTLVAWVTEFGRMPSFQKGANGRDHNPHGFTVWLAGAGVKHGFSYGATDEFGYRAVENIATLYDLHATILHLLGIDHERLSYYHNGIERRLTDVHGQVITEILA
jgi:hypothetical protein